MRLVFCNHAINIMTRLRFFLLIGLFLLLRPSAIKRFDFALDLCLWLFLFLCWLFLYLFVVHFFARHHIVIQSRIDLKFLKMLVCRPFPWAPSAFNYQRCNFLLQLFVHSSKISFHSFEWRSAKRASDLLFAAPLANALRADGVPGIKKKCTCTS